MLSVESKIDLHAPGDVQDACFHPHLPVVYLALPRSVVVADAASGLIITRLALPPGDKVERVLKVGSHHYIVACTVHSSILVWEGNSFSLQGRYVFAKGEGTRGFSAVAVSAVHPYVFFARRGGKSISQLDVAAELGTNSVLKFDGKRPVTVLSCHPTKPIFASGHSDGSVRVWDYQTSTNRVADSYNSVAVDRANLKPSAQGISILVFHPTLDYLVVASGINLVVVLKLSGERAMSVVGARVLNASAGGKYGHLTSLCFHPTRDLLVSTFSSGKVQTWSVEFDSLVSIERLEDSSVPSLDKILLKHWNDQVPSYHAPPNVRLSLHKVVHHPRLELLTCCHYSASDTKPLSTHLILGLCPPRLVSIAPPAVALQVPVNFFSGSSPALTYEFDPCYVKKTQLIRFSLLFGENVVVVRQLPPGRVIRCSRGASGSMLFATNASLVYRVGYPSYNVEPAPMPGRDVAFLSLLSEARFAILAVDGLSIQVCSTSGVEEEHSGWSSPLLRMFSSPVPSGLTYFNDTQGAILFSCNVSTPVHATPLRPDPSVVFWMESGEIVRDLVWHMLADGSHVAGVLTSRRVLILTRKLTLLAQVKAPASSSNSEYFSSIMWLENALLFSSSPPSSVSILCLNGTCCTLFSTSVLGVTLGAMLAEQLVFFVPSSVSGAEARTLRLGLLQPLMFAYLCSPRGQNASVEERHAHLTHLLDRFGASAVDSKLVDLLVRHQHQDIACRFLKNPQLPPETVFPLAFESGALSVAFRAAERPVRTSRIPMCLEEDRARFLSLRDASLQAGNLVLAEKCMSLLQDEWGCLRLGALQRNRDYVKNLSASAKDAGVREACERLLELPEFAEPAVEEEAAGDATDKNSKKRAKKPQATPIVNTQGFKAEPAAPETLPGCGAAPVSQALTLAGEVTSIAALEACDSIDYWLPKRRDYYREFEGGGFTAQTDDVSGEPEYLAAPTGYSAPVIPARVGLRRPATSISCSSVLHKRSNVAPHEVDQKASKQEGEQEEEEDLVSAASPVTKPSSPIPRHFLKRSGLPQGDNIHNSFVALSPMVHSSPPSSLRKKLPTPPSSSDEEEEEPEEEHGDMQFLMEANGQDEGDDYVMRVSEDDDDSADFPDLTLMGGEELVLQEFSSTLQLDIVDDNQCVGDSDHAYEEGVANFEARQYVVAISRLSSSIESLRRTSDPDQFQEEIQDRVAYLVAARLLEAGAKLKGEGTPSKLALKSALAASLTRLQPRHRLERLKQAVSENLAAKNYGLTLRFANSAVALDPEQARELKDVLFICETKRVNSDEWAEGYVDGGIPFCYELLVPTGASFFACSFCSATFASKGRDPGDECCACEYGTIG